MSGSERSVFISGANRGIGRGMTFLMASKGYTVVAGYRDEERSRQLLSEATENRRILPVKMDVTREDDLENLYKTITSRFGYLDILVNSAGVNPGKETDISALRLRDFTESFLVNVGGPFLTTKYLYPLLRKGRDKKIVNISSQMGSIQLSSGDMVPYRVSKAALNMLTKNQAIAYKRDGVTVVCLHPGWVKTAMGGPEAPLSVKESVTKLLQIIEMVSLSNTGQFISVHGDMIPY